MIDDNRGGGEGLRYYEDVEPLLEHGRFPAFFTAVGAGLAENQVRYAVYRRLAEEAAGTCPRPLCFMQRPYCYVV